MMDLTKMQCEWENCKTMITWNMYRTSHNRYGRGLCFLHQEQEIKNTYPPILREIALTNLKKYRKNY